MTAYQIQPDKPIVKASLGASPTAILVLDDGTIFGGMDLALKPQM